MPGNFLFCQGTDDYLLTFLQSEVSPQQSRNLQKTGRKDQIYRRSSGLFRFVWVFVEGWRCSWKMCTDWTCQQKKRILHKLCIDMERSEYTSFSMLAILKCEFQMTSILILRYMDSRGWGKAGRHSVAVSSFSASAVRLVYMCFCSDISPTNMNFPL